MAPKKNPPARPPIPPNFITYHPPTNQTRCWRCLNCNKHDKASTKVQKTYKYGTTMCKLETCKDISSAKLIRMRACKDCAKKMVSVGSGLDAQTKRKWCWRCKLCGEHDRRDAKLQAEYTSGSTRCKERYCRDRKDAMLVKYAECWSKKCRREMVDVGSGLDEVLDLGIVESKPGSSEEHEWFS
ncbi:hypothetical protein Vi05172_g6652 [Venturia inaequalis]|nr:hypothetical protein Vi05172_g6652 [Venturia inaequalis]